jgi:hypothetical protein
MFCVFLVCLPGITGYHRVSPGITGYHRVSLHHKSRSGERKAAASPGTARSNCVAGMFEAMRDREYNAEKKLIH